MDQNKIKLTIKLDTALDFFRKAIIAAGRGHRLVLLAANNRILLRAMMEKISAKYLYYSLSNNYPREVKNFNPNSSLGTFASAAEIPVEAVSDYAKSNEDCKFLFVDDLQILGTRMESFLKNLARETAELKTLIILNCVLPPGADLSSIEFEEKRICLLQNGASGSAIVFGAAVDKVLSVGSKEAGGFTEYGPMRILK